MKKATGMEGVGEGKDMRLRGRAWKVIEEVPLSSILNFWKPFILQFGAMQMWLLESCLAPEE